MADGHTAPEQARLSTFVNLNLASHRERIQFVVTPLKNGHDLLLGMSWLQGHNPAVDWETKQLTLQCAGERYIIQGNRLQRIRAKVRPKIQMVSLVKFF